MQSSFRSLIQNIAQVKSLQTLDSISSNLIELILPQKVSVPSRPVLNLNSGSVSSTSAKVVVEDEGEAVCRRLNVL